jgi:anti-sigma factor RsiW
VRLLRHFRTSRRVDPIVDDEITESFRVLVNRHLDECTDCTEAVATRRAMKETLAKYGDDPEMVDRLEHFVRDRGYVC